MSRVLPYLWYPLLFAGAIAGFAAMLAAGTTLVLATYLPTLVAGLAIIGLELRFPERLDWRPRRSDVAADAAFMALVQILLAARCSPSWRCSRSPAWMHEHAPSPWWPHDWPLGAQMVAMLLAVDFLRYWLHRACHALPAALATARSPPLARDSVHAQRRPVSSAREGPALRLRHRAVPAARRRPRGDRRLFPALRRERLLPAQQPAPALRLAELRGRQRRDASLASRARSEDGLVQFRQHHDRLGPAVRHLVPARDGGRWTTSGSWTATYPRGFWRADADAVPGAGPRRGGAHWPGASPTSSSRATCGSRAACSAGGSPAPPATRCASSARCSPGCCARTATRPSAASTASRRSRATRTIARAVPVREFEAPARLRRRGDRARRGRPDAGAPAPVHAHQRIDGPAQGHSAHRLAPPSAARHPAPVGRVSAPRLPRGLPRQHPGDRQPGRGGLARRTASPTAPPRASSPAGTPRLVREKFVAARARCWRSRTRESSIC